MTFAWGEQPCLNVTSDSKKAGKMLTTMTALDDQWVTHRTDETVDSVPALVKSDRRLSIRMMSDELPSSKRNSQKNPFWRAANEENLRKIGAEDPHRWTKAASSASLHRFVKTHGRRWRSCFENRDCRWNMMLSVRYRDKKAELIRQYSTTCQNNFGKHSKCRFQKLLWTVETSNGEVHLSRWTIFWKFLKLLTLMLCLW